MLSGKLTYLNVFGTPIVVTSSLEVARDLLEKRSAIYSSRPTFRMLNELWVGFPFIYWAHSDIFQCSYVLEFCIYGIWEEMASSSQSFSWGVSFWARCNVWGDTGQTHQVRLCTQNSSKAYIQKGHAKNLPKICWTDWGAHQTIHFCAPTRSEEFLTLALIKYLYSLLRAFMGLKYCQATKRTPSSS